MAKKQVSMERKARIAEMQRQERARERRVRLRIIAGCVVLLVILAAVVTYAVLDARGKQPDQLIATIGVAASAAACDPVTTDTATGSQEHVGPNTNTPGTTKVKYSTVPPSTGAHFASPVLGDTKFYTASDRPAMENLVHNLEHGYTILWYDQQAGAAVTSQLKALADAANGTTWARDKFIVSAWDPSYGALPSGKAFALSHWSAEFGTDGAIKSQAGHRQLCGKLSGAVVKSFLQSHPTSQSPEPNGA
ncbi:MAG TPA: DUF3105 domain-containing protein [Dermatophilaceae bacterium]|nr:DUF3105 domain-containing protein [Dermatophilaceae bacterium]